MNEKDIQNKQIEDLLKKAHLPGPSPQLHEHITIAAKNEWNKAESELPWLIPFGRMAASAAAAIIIIWIANYYSESSLAQWQNVKLIVASEQPSPVESLPEISYSPFMKRLAVLNRQPSMIETSKLNYRIEALRQILDETQPANTTKPSIPEGGSSLVPNTPGTGSYS